MPRIRILKNPVYYLTEFDERGLLKTQYKFIKYKITPKPKCA